MPFDLPSLFLSSEVKASFSSATPAVPPLMPYPIADLAVVALVMTVGSILQGAVGFASGLLGVPLLVLYGFPLLDATVINFVSTSVQNFTGAAHLRGHLSVRDVFWPAVFRCVGLPLGTLALQATSAIDPALVQQIVGGVLLASVLMLAGVRAKPREHLPIAVTALTFSISGMLMGFASIGGAPMVMYVNALTWSARKSRSFLFACSSLLMPLMAAMIIWKFGSAVVPPATAALIVMPPGIVGLVVGLRLGHQIDKDRFRQLTYSLLATIAVAAIAGPMVFKAS